MMRFRILATIPLLALAGACAQAADEANAQTADGGMAALSGEAGIAMAANCHAQLNAVSRLYSALADQSSGAERQDLANRAIARELAASQYQTLVKRLAAGIGQSSDATGRALAEAEAAINHEFETREFEDFAVWVGQQADKCPPPDVG